MKKILALFLAVGLCAAALCGCADSAISVPSDTKLLGSDMSDDSSAYRMRSDLKERKIGISVSSLRGNFMKVFRTSLMNRLKKLGFKEANVTIYENNGDTELELKMLDLLIESGVEQLLVCPNDSADVPTITNKVVAAGIPLIYFNYIPDEGERARWAENHWNVSSVGADRSQVGKLQAVLVASIGLDRLDMNHNGMLDYVLIEGPEVSPLSALRKETFLAEMAEQGVPSQCLEDHFANWSREEAHAFMEEALAKHGSNIELVLCHNDAMALGAMLAIQEAGRIVSSDIYLIGVDCELEALDNIRRGTMTGSVFVDGISQAGDVVTNIMNNIDGFANESATCSDYVLVTAANAENIQGILEHPI
ncbi:MAG: substrate-binding domain-containing protein [Lachnospiraceae bacterium]|nr:substrate-binding domain-containing protein [Lachnospiraceae bacterium]